MGIKAFVNATLARSKVGMKKEIKVKYNSLVVFFDRFDTCEMPIFVGSDNSYLHSTGQF
jgi:hypothetical protein